MIKIVLKRETCKEVGKQGNWIESDWGSFPWDSQ